MGHGHWGPAPEANGSQRLAFHLPAAVFTSICGEARARPAGVTAGLLGVAGMGVAGHTADLRSAAKRGVGWTGRLFEGDPVDLDLVGVGGGDEEVVLAGGDGGEGGGGF